MDYDAILAQVLTMLQQEQRLAYRVLKRRFQLDDEILEDLKDDLIYAKKLAVDEEGRVLVWTGGIDMPPRTTPSEPQPVLLAVPQETRPSQGEASPAVLRTPEAERRQLTVMFCDLVDSTRLSGQLDPEDLREVVRAYQQVCSAVITHFDGHIAQLLGDGLLVYFGYPQAHEDDAQRAVRTGLGILAAMKDLNTRLKQAKAIQLAIRLGIHTGLVVVGAMGGGGRQEQLALGETPNIASRIQGLAAPDTVIISDATSRLVQGYFDCQDLGAQTLRGVAQPLHVYRVFGESGVHSRLDIASARGLTPLVGREQEVGLLLERWGQIKDGQGHVVLLTGDAGIGKSRLVQMLKEHVAQEPHVRWECRSSSYYQNTALFPLVDLFQRLLRFEAHETPDEKLEKLAQALSQYRLPLEESVPLFAPLLAPPVPENRYPLLNLSPQRQRQKTLETIVAILLELTEHQPVLFIVEDLHWSDPSTLELLNLVIDQIPTAALFVLLTCRPTFQPTWSHRAYLTEITVNRLAQHQIVAMVERVAGGKTFPHEVMHQIVEKTDGVPLAVEELTKMVLESGLLQEREDHYELSGPLPPLAIPTTLHDSLMARLDRLATVKSLAQLGATLGREFSYRLLQAVSPLDELTLQHGLQQLVDAELLYRRGVPPQATYVFKHALIQDAAYQSLLKSTRQQVHQRIAQALEERFPETKETQPELLAHHCTEAGLSAQAVEYWQRAGRRALERSANLEAVGHLTKGLEVLKTLPDIPERTQHELVMQTTLGPALMATKGYGATEVEHVYARARELCQQVGETARLFPVLWGLWYFYLSRVELRTARELGEQLLSLAQRLQDPVLLLLAHRALGQTLYWPGEFVPAHVHLEQGRGLYDFQQHRFLAFLYGRDPGVDCQSFAAWTLWWLGYPDQALAMSHAALTLAQELTHPHSLAFALNMAAILHQYRQEGQAASVQAQAAMALSREREFPQWLAVGTFLGGWALVKQGLEAEGIAQMHQGLAAWQATGAETLRPYFLGLLAEAYGNMGRAEEGLHVLAEALGTAEKTGERFYEAELYRLKGELVLARSMDNEAEAETSFRQALTVVRRQEAKSLELRAATSLSRLWQRQGKRVEARELLAPIYGWFTEGFDTADLQEAKALLEELH